MTRLGFGASGPWAERWFSERKAGAVLRAAVDAGVRDLDTGPSYARGNAEPRLGRLVAALAEQGGPTLRLTSKVGTQIGEGGRLIKDFSDEAIDRQLSASLAALDVPALDVLYLHGPDEHALSPALSFLNEAKSNGRARATGVVADDRHVSRAAEAGPDWIMSPYNLLDQRNGESLRAARRAGVKVAVVAPLAQGLWRRDIAVPRSLPTAWYAARAMRDRDRLRAARAEERLRSVPGWSPVELAIAFVRVTLAPELVLTTSTKPAHVTQTAAALARPIPDALHERLQGWIVA